MKKILLLFLWLINTSIVNSKEEEDIFELNKNLRFCGAGLDKYEIKHYSTKSQKLKKHSTRNLKTLEYRPIRIYLETTFFDSQEVEQSLEYQKTLLKKALNNSVNAFSKLLEVEDIGDENIFSFIDTNVIFRENSIDKWNPIFDSDSNIQSDFLLIVKFDNENKLPERVLASASPIALDEETHRPLIGILTIGRDTNFYYRGRVEDYFSKVFLHEITHALGFLPALYEFFPTGKETVKQYEIRGVWRYVIATPKVIEAARKYYNCSNIYGVELEDQGGDGSALCHWEQRTLLGDYMGAVIYQEEMAISEITLALLEDSGWYRANYYTGGLMRFGKNKGCQFLQNYCLYGNYITDFVNEFFDINNKDAPSCSTGRQSRTYSFLTVYQFVDDIYYYNFLNDKSSGSIYTADYCFIHNQHPDEYFSYFTGNCKLGNGYYGNNVYYYNSETQKYEKGHSNNYLPKELGEIYSNTSFCVMSSLVPNGKHKLFGSVFHPMCYQMHCSSSFLTIQINDDYIVCPRTGGNVQLKGYDGKLHCPDYNLICTGTVLCNDIFDCIEKKSLVKNDTYFYDYISLTTQLYSQIPSSKDLVAYELSDDGICPLYCSQCSKNKKCKICLNGYNLVGVNYNDTNPIICDNKIDIENGYYKNEDNVYYLCSEECITCFEKDNKCSVCKENYYFLENSNNCYNTSNYPKGYYFNKEKNIFSHCHSNCQTCTEGPISDDNMNCDTCKNGFEYDSKNKNCYKIESNKNESNKNESNIFLWIFIPIIILVLIAAIGIIIFIIFKKKQSSEDSSSGIEMSSKKN